MIVRDILSITWYDKEKSDEDKLRIWDEKLIVAFLRTMHSDNSHKKKLEAENCPTYPISNESQWNKAMSGSPHSDTDEVDNKKVEKSAGKSCQCSECGGFAFILLFWPSDQGKPVCAECCLRNDYYMEDIIECRPDSSGAKKETNCYVSYRNYFPVTTGAKEVIKKVISDELKKDNIELRDNENKESINMISYYDLLDLAMAYEKIYLRKVHMDQAKNEENVVSMDQEISKRIHDANEHAFSGYNWDALASPRPPRHVACLSLNALSSVQSKQKKKRGNKKKSTKKLNNTNNEKLLSKPSFLQKTTPIKKKLNNDSDNTETKHDLQLCGNEFHDKRIARDDNANDTFEGKLLATLVKEASDDFGMIVTNDNKEDDPNMMDARTKRRFLNNQAMIYRQFEKESKSKAKRSSEDFTRCGERSSKRVKRTGDASFMSKIFRQAKPLDTGNSSSEFVSVDLRALGEDVQRFESKGDGNLIKLNINPIQKPRKPRNMKKNSYTRENELKGGNLATWLSSDSDGHAHLSDKKNDDNRNSINNDNNNNIDEKNTRNLRSLKQQSQRAANCNERKGKRNGRIDDDIDDESVYLSIKKLPMLQVFGTIDVHDEMDIIQTHE